MSVRVETRLLRSSRGFRSSVCVQIDFPPIPRLMAVSKTRSPANSGVQNMCSAPRLLKVPAVSQTREELISTINLRTSDRRRWSYLESLSSKSIHPNLDHTPRREGQNNFGN